MHHIAPLMKEYTRRFPNLRVHIEAANRYVDIIDSNIDSNIDVAIRIREFEPDSNVTIRRLGETRRILVGSPRYCRSSKRATSGALAIAHSANG